ncbi:aminopeptidase M1-like [Quercus lobata]|uniref:membrane alanyl aminopeptidase n=1 Tax=Quercus lobata TaxID=97700 RepID=A0A7N2MAK9_QUELO|nr:aminopeptidase M1-like [Quercus lobata]
MAFLLPVAWELSWELGLLMGVGAAVAAGSILRNTNNGGFRNINNGGFHIPLIHRNQPTTQPVPVQHKMSEVEEDANEDSSKKEEDANEDSSEKEEDEIKKLRNEIVKEVIEGIAEEALEVSMMGPPQKSIEQFKGQPRLPKFAVPIRYNIRLKPDLNACKFAGSVAIELNIVADTSFIVLNAAELSVDTASVSFTHSSISKVLKPLKVHVVEEDEILVLDFADTLLIGIGFLTIHFQGTLNDKMKGFYTSTFEHNGEKKNVAVTQFEPVGARRCFPCWDEPACKAMFKITLDVPSKLVALSNMPIIEEKIDGDLKTVSYQESPIMSTYLVAIVIGLFDYVEHLTSDGVKVRVYCQVGKLNQGRFALDVAVRTLELYKEYFAVPYFLPKLDMVAIPDFAFGTMANYGLVTCCETDLLYDNQYSTAANKQRVVIVVAHELAHQWFGNLVTIEWWTHLWLNEGFATWVSYLAANHLFPEWKMWTQFLDDYTEGLRLDGLAESHPIEVEINHAREIDEIVNAISYNKGASVIRMLQSYLGAECFQRSLASYIKKFARSNAKTKDLWAALEEGSGAPVNKLMNSWTKQKGYPVISVKVKDRKLLFEQSQFLASGSHGDGQWIVPITLCCGSYDVQKNFLLQTKSETLDMKELLSDENNLASTWVKLNVNQTGFYRVKYDEDLAAKLRYVIENKYLSATDRFGILDDSFALCMAGQQSLTSLLTLMGAYKEELDYTVLSNLINISYKVERIAADATPDLLNFIKLFFNLFQGSAMKLGWEPKTGESHLDAMLRGEVLTALAVFGHDLTLKEANRRFRAFLDDRNTPLLHPNIRKAAYVAVMREVRTSNRFGYESLLRVYRETNSSQEKTRVLSSLTSSPDPNIIVEALNFLLSSEVRTLDAVLGLAVSREGRETAWTWMKDNWEHISKTWGSGNLITHFVNSIVSPFASFEKAKEIEEFFASRTNSKIARTLKQSIERVHINANWVQRVHNEEHLGETVTKLLIQYGEIKCVIL